MAKDTKTMKRIIEFIVEYVDKLDKSGTNGRRYRDRLSKMSLKEFDSFMNDLRTGEEQLYINTPNMDSDYDMDFYELVGVGEELGVFIFERIYFTDQTTGRMFLSNQEYMILKLPVRRVRQYIAGKMGLPEGDTKINPMTGQVTGEDKGASHTYVEMQSQASKEQYDTLFEFTKVRGGDPDAYAEFKRQLENTGTASAGSVGRTTRAKSSIALGSYLAAAHIDSNV
jgi:hypothetical protein